MSAGLTAPLVGVWADQQYVLLLGIMLSRDISTCHFQRSQEVMSNLLRDIRSYVWMYIIPISSRFARGSGPGWDIHLDPLLGLRIMVNFIFDWTCPRAIRPVYYHGQGDTLEWFHRDGCWYHQQSASVSHRVFHRAIHC